MEEDKKGARSARTRADSLSPSLLKEVKLFSFSASLGYIYPYMGNRKKSFIDF